MKRTRINQKEWDKYDRFDVITAEVVSLQRPCISFKTPELELISPEYLVVNGLRIANELNVEQNRRLRRAWLVCRRYKTPVLDLLAKLEGLAVVDLTEQPDG